MMKYISIFYNLVKYEDQDKMVDSYNMIEGTQLEQKRKK